MSVFYERFFLIDCGRVEKIMFTWVHEFSEKCLPESMNSLNILNAKMPQLCLQYRATEKQEQKFHKNSFRSNLRTSSFSRYKIIFRIFLGLQRIEIDKKQNQWISIWYLVIIQGCLQKDETSETKYRIYTVLFLIFLIPYQCELVYFFVKSLNKSLKAISKSIDLIQPWYRHISRFSCRLYSLIFFWVTLHNELYILISIQYLIYLVNF